jgi:hypothetical protein
VIVDFEFDTRENEEEEEVGGSEVSVWDDGVMGVVPHSHKDGLYDVMDNEKCETLLLLQLLSHWQTHTLLGSAIIDFWIRFLNFKLKENIHSVANCLSLMIEPKEITETLSIIDSFEVLRFHG